MSAITRDELKRALKQKQIEPLYLLFGQEEYLRDRAAQAIAEAALKDAPLREFNESDFSLNSGSIMDALAAAEQLPMMADRRVVRITDFSKIRDADEEALTRYLARPVETTTVILITDDLDKRRKLTKTLLDKCATVEFARLHDGELAAWARIHLKELKAEADERTLHQIIALTGSDVRVLSNELEKLATAALPSGRITMEMVDELVGNSRELTNFELTDHLIARNRPGALKILHKILGDGAEPVMLIGLIASNFHKLALAKELMSRGASENEVFRLVGPMYGKKRQDFLATARRTDASLIAHRIERIAAADIAIKTSRATPRLQLELLVCELAT
jgi:DNA polymerase-3 subunit delta